MKKAMRTGLAALFVLAVTMTSCKDGNQSETENANTEMTSGETTTDEMTTDTTTTTISSADSTGTSVPGTTSGSMEQVP